MLDTKELKDATRSIGTLQNAITAAVRAIEGAVRASPDDPMPQAAVMLMETLVSRAGELSAAAKHLEASAKQLKKTAAGAVDQEIDSITQQR